MRSLNEIVRQGNSLGINVNFVRQAIILTPKSRPKLKILIIFRVPNSNILRISQHRTPELTKEHYNKNVSVKWIIGFMEKYGETLSELDHKIQKMNHNNEAFNTSSLYNHNKKRKALPTSAVTVKLQEVPESSKRYIKDNF